jgi:predicted N-acetyltransferase YhbS
MTARSDRIADVVIRPLREADLPVAEHIKRVALGTFLGVPEPSSNPNGVCYVRNRWKSDPAAGFAAEMGGEVVGSILAARWGSFGFFGPLTIRPDFWGHGIGGRLIEPVMNLLSQSRVRLTGLFTFPHSPKHLGLYQKFGFRPRFLTAIMAKAVAPSASALRWCRYSQLSQDEKVACLRGCLSVADSVFAGLDLTIEIRAIDTMRLGDTIILYDGTELVAFAACHQGAQTEAGSGACYVKFAAVRPSGEAARYFQELLKACEGFAGSVTASRLVAGVNTARLEAYEEMLDRGFRTEILGIAMHTPNEPGFSRAGIFVLDDWR